MKLSCVISGKKVEVNRFGRQKKVLFLLAGWTHDFQFESKFIRELTKTYTVVTYSYPGYATSDENHLAQSPVYLSKIIDNVCSELHIRPTLLVGFSMGCQVVVSYLQTHPKMRAVCISPLLHPLDHDAPWYANIVISHPWIVRCVRDIWPIKQYFVDMANAQIGDVTEGKHIPGHADLTHVSLNGAFDTLIATVGTFTDPVQFTDRISFLFGERETERQRLDELHIPYRIIPSSGHGAFEKKASVIARMIR